MQWREHLGQKKLEGTFMEQTPLSRNGLKGYRATTLYTLLTIIFMYRPHNRPNHSCHEGLGFSKLQKLRAFNDKHLGFWLHAFKTKSKTNSEEPRWMQMAPLLSIAIAHSWGQEKWSESQTSLHHNDNIIVQIPANESCCLPAEILDETPRLCVTGKSSSSYW